MSEPENYEDHLARTDLFSGLSRRTLKKLSSRSRVVEHDTGHRIAEEGLGALAFHLVLDGAASVSHGGQRIRTLGPGDYFGEMSVIDGKPRSADVEATEPLRTLVVPYQVFQELLDSEPTFTRALLDLLCSRLREAESRQPAGDGG